METLRERLRKRSAPLAPGSAVAAEAHVRVVAKRLELLVQFALGGRHRLLEVLVDHTNQQLAVVTERRVHAGPERLAKCSLTSSATCRASFPALDAAATSVLASRPLTIQPVVVPTISPAAAIAIGSIPLASFVVTPQQHTQERRREHPAEGGFQVIISN